MIEQEVEEFLEHYGVKGMKWGVRKDRSGPSNRQLNKASRSKDKARINKQIDTARKRTKGTSRLAKIGIGDKGSKSYVEYKEAKIKYKQDKIKIGSREAKKSLSKAKEKRAKDLKLAATAKSGRETVEAILLNTGKTAINFRGDIVPILPT